MDMRVAPAAGITESQPKAKLRRGFRWTPLLVVVASALAVAGVGWWLLRAPAFPGSRRGPPQSR